MTLYNPTGTNETLTHTQDFNYTSGSYCIYEGHLLRQSDTVLQSRCEALRGVVACRRLSFSFIKNHFSCGHSTGWDITIQNLWAADSACRPVEWLERNALLIGPSSWVPWIQHPTQMHYMTLNGIFKHCFCSISYTNSFPLSIIHKC